MNLFILAAGSGRRMYPLTKDRPKSLLDLGDGSTLLDKQLELALSNPAITSIYIVTGYKHEQIDAKVEEYTGQKTIHSVYNPFFDISNNLMSLWCSHHHFSDEDFIITNGDNIYKPVVFDRLTSSREEGIFITIDHKEHYDEDDMKVIIHQGHIQRISKKIDPVQSNAESVGLVKVVGQHHRELFQKHLLQLIKQDKSRDAFWLEIFNALIDNGHPVSALEIGQHDWGEMDFHPDVELMKKAITQNIF
jgi:choline kinase